MTGMEQNAASLLGGVEGVQRPHIRDGTSGDDY
jgi:hypothetical protein